MSGFDEDFLAHLAGGVTTVCHCWRVTRRDGVVLGFTDHDRTISIDAIQFEPQTGFTAGEARDAIGLAPDAADVEGALSSDRISEADIAAGRYDGAKVETLLVNWREPAQHAVLRTATVGTIVREDGRFRVELESLSAALDRPSGRTYRRNCDAELGDARCRFALGTAGFRANGTMTALSGKVALVASGLGEIEDGWFDHGLVSWTGGEAAGTSQRISTHRRVGADAVLTFWNGEVAGAAGDMFTVTAGCDKRFATCREKFDNALNFQGFPHMPGNDAAYAYVHDGAEFDGGPLVP